MAERFLCRDASTARDEPQHATASIVRRWLLLEQTGGWGRDVLTDNSLPDEVNTHLQRLAKGLRVRVLFIRRPVRPRVDITTAVRGFAVVSGRGGWAERFRLGVVDELLDLDLAALGDHRSVGGERIDWPLYLVCTHGRHDTCCALYGRPLANALEAVRPEETWECSHVGGDRFAANLVVLPRGRYLGRVGPADVPGVVADLEAGRLPLAFDRGQAGWAFPVQAAAHLLRRAEGWTGLEDLDLRARSTRGHITEATFALPDGTTRTVTVERYPAAEAVRTTCTLDHGVRPPRYRLIAVA